jgi:hypothetical protein
MAALATAFLLTAPRADAAEDADLRAIRVEMNALKRDYEAHIRALESRLKHAEEDAKAARTIAAIAAARVAPGTAPETIAVNAPAKRVAVPALITPSPQAATEAAGLAPPVPPSPLSVESSQPYVPPPVAPRAPASLNAQNPGISVVLNGNYVASSHDPTAARVPGFALGDEAGLEGRGFSLGESEVTLAANIDPFLYGNVTAALTGDNEVAVEEAYVQTTHFGHGLTLKGGRFFSGIGYLNERHAHNWTFVDAPLPYRALLGNQYGDDGVQVRWLAPVDLFLEFGAEWFRGDSFPAGNAPRSGMGTATGFVHSGGDINDASSWLAAASYIRTEAKGRDTGGDIFSGDDELGIASLVYKWAPNGNVARQNLVLSGEYFSNREHGDFDGVPVDLKRDGWYAQGVFQFRPHWSAGLRYAQLGTESVDPTLIGSTLDDFGHRPRTATALFEYDTSEFGRFRLQYSRDIADLKANDELFLQYTVVYGPHGAHRY